MPDRASAAKPTVPDLTPRVSKAMEAGSINELFPLLHQWSEEELRALVDDIDVLHQVLQTRLDDAYHKAVMKPENFFSKERSKRIDDAHKAASIDMLGTLVEISSVALFYLPEGRDA